MQENSTLILEPVHPANASVIWLHGLGADAHDFIPVVEQLNFPDELKVRFIFPNAPMRPITLNAGAVMPGWFDIIGIGPEYREDEEGIRSSQLMIEALIEKENQQGIESNRIILAGFSQGGAVVLQSGIRYPGPLAGILALSTYLPLRHSVESEIQVVQQNTPILFMHGTQDQVVPVEFAKHAYNQLKTNKLNVAWQEYAMQHSVCTEQIRDINSFIVDNLS
ncbi:MAG: carboxylesterase [Gammaproteobacteria bacterium]|nr:carboxylesterase [Gammaproteobacteria bacterium]